MTAPLLVDGIADLASTGWTETKAEQLTAGTGVGQALIFPDTSQEKD